MGMQISIEQAYEWVVERLSGDQPVSADEISRRLGPELDQQVILLLNYLVAKGLATRTVAGHQTSYTAMQIASIRQLLREKAIEERPSRRLAPPPRAADIVIAEPEGIAASLTSEPETLVVSAPLSLAGKVAALFVQYPELSVLDIKTAFKTLLERTKHEVLLSLPFLELDGLMYFTDQILGLGQRGVVVKLLTRELLWPRQYNYTYLQKLKAFAKFLDLYVAGGGIREQVEVCDYTIRIGSVGDERLLYEGIHQKMIVIDGEMAYIGSGEIRSASFVSNGDVGVIHSGGKAHFWRDYFFVFWTEAEPVEHRFFERNIQ